MDPYEQLLLKMYVSNTFLLAQLQFQKAKKPRWAKLIEMVNGDFLMNFDRYVAELGKVKMMATAKASDDLEEVDAMLQAQKLQLETMMAA